MPRLLALAFLAFAALAPQAVLAQARYWYQASAAQSVVPDTAPHQFPSPSADVTLTATTSRVTVGAPGGAFFTVQAPPAGFHVGNFENAVRANTSVTYNLPGLDVSSAGGVCFSDSGRFWVQEWAVDSNSNVTKLAIDLEVHCNGAPAIYAEVRFNSTVPFTSEKPPGSTMPDLFAFANRGPVVHSTVVASDITRIYGINAPAAISITGGEYSINGGAWTSASGTIQNLDLLQVRTTAPAADAMTASANVAVDGVNAVFSVSTYDPAQPLSAIYLARPGFGITSYYAAPDCTVRAALNYQGLAGITAYYTCGASSYGNANFQPRPAQTLGVGAYEDAARSPFKGASPGIDFNADGGGCNTEWGRFTILEFVLAPDGTIARFAADFEQRCGTVDATPMFGEIRFNSMVPLTMFKAAGSTRADAFDLAVPNPVKAGSVVTSYPISVLGVNAPVPVSITRGEYSINGGAFTSAPGTANLYDRIVVRTVAARAAGSLVSAVLDLGGQSSPLEAWTYKRGDVLTGLWYVSYPSSGIGLAHPTFYQGPAIQIAGTRSSGVNFTINTEGGGWWYLNVPATVGATDPTGVFDFFYGNGYAGGNVSGHIVVLEATFNPDGSLQSYAADFEQRVGTNSLNPPTFGQVRYHSTIPFSSQLSLAPKIDFDADGLADLILTTTDGAVRLVTATADQVVIGAGTGKKVVATGDFDGDGRTDLLVENADGSTDLWIMNGTSATVTTIMAAGTDWRVGRVGDFNGDGKSDIAWANGVDGSVAMWLMNGTAILQRGLVMNPATGWALDGVGDFNGDGRTDIVWHNADGTTSVWLMNGLAILDRGPIMAAGTPWRIARIGDFNGDGKSDILWNSAADNTTSLWVMSGRSIVDRGVVMPGGTAWNAMVVGDFDGDGRDDIVWYNTDGRVGVWLMHDRTIVAKQTVMAAGNTWTPARADDVDGDGHSDILWVTPNDASTPAWFMNGTTTVANVTLGGTGWRVWDP